MTAQADLAEAYVSMVRAESLIKTAVKAIEAHDCDLAEELEVIAVALEILDRATQAVDRATSKPAAGAA